MIWIIYRFKDMTWIVYPTIEGKCHYKIIERLIEKDSDVRNDFSHHRNQSNPTFHGVGGSYGYK